MKSSRQPDGGSFRTIHRGACSRRVAYCFSSTGAQCGDYEFGFGVRELLEDRICRLDAARAQAYARALRGRFHAFDIAAKLRSDVGNRKKLGRVPEEFPAYPARAGNSLETLSH